MRQSILSYLLAHRGEFISGQRLSEELGITRTAVWKHICMLREKGILLIRIRKRVIALQAYPTCLTRKRYRKRYTPPI